jgi:hypothetical protein
LIPEDLDKAISALGGESIGYDKKSVIVKWSVGGIINYASRHDLLVRGLNQYVVRLTNSSDNIVED